MAFLTSFRSVENEPSLRPQKSLRMRQGHSNHSSYLSKRRTYREKQIKRQFVLFVLSVCLCPLLSVSDLTPAVVDGFEDLLSEPRKHALDLRHRFKPTKMLETHSITKAKTRQTKKKDSLSRFSSLFASVRFCLFRCLFLVR